LRDVAATPFYRRSGLTMTLDTDEGALMLATYHPHPQRRAFLKAADFGTLAGQLGTSGPAILCGDFNAVMPADRPDPAQLEQGFARFTAPDKLAETVRRFIESGEQVHEMLTRAGFVDLVGTQGHTIPTDLASLNKASAMRIDHAYGRAIKVARAAIVRHRLCEEISDHYPILVEFSLSA